MKNRVRHKGLAAFAVLAASVAACTAGSGTPTPLVFTPAPAGVPAQTWSAEPDGGVSAIFATPDLAPGNQRVGFVLVDDDGLVRLPFVHTSLIKYGETAAVASDRARFHEFPLGTRGLYVTYFDIPDAGTWLVVPSIPRPDGSIAKPVITVRVNRSTQSVAVGERPPASANKTLADVSSISNLTTGSLRDPELYRTRFSEAFLSGEPSVVVFASPAFCTNEVCGPQVEVLSKLRAEYGGSAHFIHVDIYDNPHEIQGDFSLARLSPILDEWGLTSQEWTYVVGRDGLVASRFENFAPEDEVRAALDAALARE